MYIKFRKFYLIRNRDFSRARIRRPTCTIGDTENWADVSFSCQNF
jgi:hypothetical protein